MDHVIGLHDRFTVSSSNNRMNRSISGSHLSDLKKKKFDFGVFWCHANCRLFDMLAYHRGPQRKDRTRGSDRMQGNMYGSPLPLHMSESNRRIIEAGGPTKRLYQVWKGSNVRNPSPNLANQGKKNVKRKPICLLFEFNLCFIFPQLIC